MNIAFQVSILDKHQNVKFKKVMTHGWHNICDRSIVLGFLDDVGTLALREFYEQRVETDHLDVFEAHCLHLTLNHGEALWPQLITFILSGYVFKLVVAFVDTGPIYLLVRWLRPYLGLTGYEEARRL